MKETKEHERHAIERPRGMTCYAAWVDVLSSLALLLLALGLYWLWLKTDVPYILVFVGWSEGLGCRLPQGAWARFIDRQVVATIRPCFPQDQ